MLWVNKIKESTKGVLKEHPVSIVVFLIASIIVGISEDVSFSKVTVRHSFEFLSMFLMCLTPVFVLCESNFAYKKKIGKISSLKEFKKSAVYAVISVIGLIISAVHAYYFSFGEKTPSTDFSVYFLRICYVYLAVCALSALFFMYKKSGESFETYAVKAFLGVMKAWLVHMIVTLGAMSILMIFGALFFQLECQTFILMLVCGIVGFPAYMMALTAPGEKMLKFSKIVMGYVFPGILMTAFVIVYAYIIKILVTWTFPSNEVFSIMTGVFCSGIMIWTMALGCTEGKINSLLKIMPLLFIPFIVVQCICLAMRIDQYGITASRYLGILLIVFEVLYEGYYIFRLRRNEGIGGILMPALLFFVVVYYLMPGVNVYASITNSQKAVVSGYIHLKQAGGEVTSPQLARARSGYQQIIDNGGLEGKHYLEKLYAESSKKEIEDMLETSTTYSTSDRSYYVYTTDSRAEIDIEGYSHLCHIETSNVDDLNLSEVPFWTMETGHDEEPYVTADLTGIISKLRTLEMNEADYSEKSAAISEPVRVGSGLFYIETIDFMFDVEAPESEVNDLMVEGYYLY